MSDIEIATPTRLQDLPSWLLGQAAVRSHRLLVEAFGAIDARGYHYRILAALDDLGPSSQAVLGRSAGLDRSDVAISINELVAAGAVQRVSDPADVRRNRVSLTKDGQSRLRQLDTVVAEVQEVLLRQLSTSERALFVELLTRMQP